MRKTIMSLLEGANSGALSWHQQGSLDEAPPRPFGTYRLRITERGVTAQSKVRPVGLEIWVHDDPGSYLRIDGILNKLEAVFDVVVNASAAEGENIAQTRWEERSPDLNDDGLRTITKMVSYTLIGKGQ